MSAIPETALFRDGQLRCPACIRFKPFRGACPECGCGEIHLQHHGAARVLLQAGVDRSSLAQRVAELEPGQRKLLGEQYAEQWAEAWPLLAEVRRCESHLIQEGFTLDTEDMLAALIPTSPELLAQQVGPPKRPETLEELFVQSTSAEVRRLAGLALLHGGMITPELLASARDSLFDASWRIRVEAMSALSHWWVWPWVQLNEGELSQLRELAKKTLGDAKLRPRAAVAWMRASRGQPPEEEVLSALRKGLRYNDEREVNRDVRFECVLCLLGSTDPKTVSKVHEALGMMGRPELFGFLGRPGDAAFARNFEALLLVSEQGPHRLTEVLVPILIAQPFDQWSEEARARWRTWARVALREASGADALTALHHVAVPPVIPEEMRAFVEAAAEALAREPAKQRADNMHHNAFRLFLMLAGPAEEPLLNRWAREAECADRLAWAIMTLSGHMRDWKEAPGQEARLLMAVWEGPGRQALLEPLKKNVSSYSHKKELIDVVWRRFQEHPEERGELAFVFSSWEPELRRRQLAVPEDPIVSFETWWRANPVKFPGYVLDLMRGWASGDVPRHVRCVLSAADEVVKDRPRTAAQAVWYAAETLANAFSGGAPELVPEAERFLEWFTGFEQRVRETPAERDNHAPANDFLKEIHSKVSVIRERLDLVRKAEERRRQDELRPGWKEKQQREQERQAREAAAFAQGAEARQHRREERQLKIEEARRAAEAERARWTETRLETLRPRIESKPIDSEPIFPGKVLSTPLDYARLFKAMTLGDQAKALASVGLDRHSLSEEALAWGQVAQKRPELRKRIKELMDAPWE